MKPHDIEERLQNKFNFQKNQEHKKHRWWELKLPGLAPVATFFSHSNDEIGYQIETKIARQLKVNSSYLRGMVNCNHSCEDYYKRLKGER
jgi:hypothetical protein